MILSNVFMTLASLVTLCKCKPLCELNEGTCVINLDSFTGRFPPLLWSPHTGNFLWPERVMQDQRLIDLDAEEEVLVVCHAATESYPTELLGFNTSQLLLQCTNDGSITLKNSSTVVNVSDLACTDRHEPWLIIENGSRCALESVDAQPIHDLSLIKVGWYIDQSFVTQYRVCQDTKRYITLWSDYVIDGSVIHMKDDIGKRPAFRRDVRGQKRTFVDFHTNKELLECFTKKWQEQQVYELLGHNVVPWSGQPIVDASGSWIYLSRGHLAPVASFVYKAMQEATFYLYNAAHQYQSFNGGNWRLLEMAVRDLAQVRDRKILVRTGTFGILSFRDIKGQATELHMFTETEYFLPVPKYFWKAIYDPINHEAIVLIGLNNPHVLPCIEEKPLCTSICDQLEWLKLKFNQTVMGVMHCCRVEELQSIIQYLPYLWHEIWGWPKLLKNWV